MELDELRNRWAELEVKLDKNKLLEVKIAKEIHKNQYNKSLSQLINYTFWGCIITLLAIILFIVKIDSAYFGPLKMTLFFLIIAFALCYFIFGVTNLKLLYKIDYSKPVNHNLALTRKYQIRIKKQSLTVNISIVIILIFAIIASIQSPDMELWRWVTIAAAIIIGVLTAIWEYKRIYKKNLDSILRSLDEINELREPEDETGA